MASIVKWKGDKWRARTRTPEGESRSKVFVRKVDAERWVTAQEHGRHSGAYVDPASARTTLATYARDWMAAQPWRPSTRARSESIYRTHVEPKFGARQLGALRTSELQAWVTGLGATLAPASVEGALTLLASILKGAVADRMLAASPADRVRLPRPHAVTRVPLTVPEVRRLADAVPPELHAAVLLAGGVGLRQGELFGVTEDRVRWLRRELVIDRQLLTPSKGAPYLGPTKTARSVRTAPLPDHLVTVLAEHRERFGVGTDGLLFHRAGAPWRRNRAAAAFARAAQAAQVPATGWHALRHHAASVLIAQGLGVTAVAATLGHSPSECLRTYAAWWPSEDDTVRSAIARAWAVEPSGEGAAMA